VTAILGIDPGLSGAFVIYTEGDHYAAVTVFDTPTIEVRVGKATKRQLDVHQLGNWLGSHCDRIRFAVIERVGPMPAQGVTSSFNFGFSTGAIHGALAAYQIQVQLVSPQMWKKQFGLIGQDKDASRQAASRLAPQFAENWPLKKHDGRAEAFLLALYGRKLERVFSLYNSKPDNTAAS